MGATQRATPLNYYGHASRAGGVPAGADLMMLDLADRTLCSAGVSYFHVYPNGDVYRCLADYNARRPPMFNLKRDGWQGAVNPTVCDHERCSNACDLDWTTKWRIDREGRLEETVEGQRKDLETAVSPFLCSQRLESPQRRMAHFIWSPTLACNYTCAYCGCAAGEKQIKKDFPSSAPELTVDEWIDVWSDILDRFDYGIFSVTGGEPLISDATIPVLSTVGQKFGCYVTSNVSRNVMEFTRGAIRPGQPTEVEGFGEVPVGLAGINCSLHPTSRGFNWELFKGAVLLLRNAGYRTSVNYVGYPVQLYLAPEYKAWCDQHGIEFTLSSWQGVDNEGTRSRYLPAEQSFFEEMAPAHRKKANELVFVDYAYDVEFHQRSRRVLMSDVFTLTGTVRNRSSSAWQVGSGPGRWSVGAYVTRIGRAREWLHEFHPTTAECVVAPGGSLEFGIPIDTRGLAAGLYQVWVDLVMDDRDWMAFHGATPAAATVRVESFSHEIALDAEAVTLSPEDTAVLSGTLRNTCGRPWPQGADGPLNVGARLFSRALDGPAIREYRAPLPALPATPDDAVPFSLVLDPRELKRGDYALSIDVVKENQFWLAEKGATPRVIPVVIA